MKPKQSLAVAYNVKKQAGPKKVISKIPPAGIDSEASMSKRASEDQRVDFMAMGGMADHNDNIDSLDMDGKKMVGPANPSLAQAHMEMDDEDQMIMEILQKRRQMYAQGGEVDLDHNSMEQPNSFYERNEDAALKENYDEDMEDVSQPEDSNEHGDKREDDEENEDDMVGQIRKKMKSKK